MAIDVNGKSIETDEEGYLANLNDWEKDVATVMAKEDDIEIVQGVFSLKYLTLFTKCTNLCQTIQVYLKNDYPLIICYSVGNLGEIKMCLAPKQR